MRSAVTEPLRANARHAQEPEVADHLCHEKCGGNAFPGYIADEQAEHAIDRLDKIVQIAAHLCSRRLNADTVTALREQDGVDGRKLC